MATVPADKPAPPVAPGMNEAAPGGTLPAGQDEMLPPGTPAGSGRLEKDAAGRVRRPADLLLAVLSLAVVALVVGSIRALPLGSTELADDVSSWVHHIPGLLSFGAEVVSGVACSALAVVAVVVLIRGQWQDARNAAAAGVTGAAAAVAATAVWRAENGAVQHAVLHGSSSFIFVVDTAFVAFVVGTDLTRRSHWSRWWPCAVVALLISGLAVDVLTPFAVVLVFFGGASAGWLVRWLLGAASVLPGAAELVAWLRSQGAAVRDLTADRRARLDGTLSDGTRIQVRLYGRDTRGSGLARRLWALARLQPAVAGHIALSSRVQVEQLALACYLAQQADVPSPAVRLLGEMPGETLVLVTSIPGSEPEAGAAPRPEAGAVQQPEAGVAQLAAQLTGATALFAALRRLHNVGVAHRDIQPANVFMSGNRAGFRSLDAAEPGASELTRRLDLVQALATLAVTCGPAGAVTALRAGYGPVDQVSVAAVVQPVALVPWGWRAARAATGSLNEIRHELLGDTPAAPAAPRLERFRWRTVVTAVALAVAAYLLIGEISGVNVLGT